MNSAPLPSVSIVVATIDRLEAVELCLDRLHALLDVAVEAIVVIGPGGDEVAEQLAQRSDIAALIRNPDRNLSKSRNMALSVARGEFVAFIDDDAYPTEWWLEDLLGEFEDEEVLAVGGTVYDYTGYTYQMRYGRCTNAGDATPVNAPPLIGLSECPSAQTFTYATGGNFIARTQGLLDLGGFDEQFDYYLEEADLCRRILDAGYIVRVLDAGQIFHKFLPSAIRSSARVALDRRSILVNRAYFAARHQLPDQGPELTIEAFERFAERAVNELEAAVRTGIANEDHLTKVRRDARDARFMLDEWVKEPPAMRISTFHAGTTPQFRTSSVLHRSSDSISHIVIVSDHAVKAQDPELDLAMKLMTQGHIVRIIEPSKGHSTVDVEDGVWRHKISPNLKPQGLAASAAFELERICAEQRVIDLAYVSTAMDENFANVLGDSVLAMERF